MGLLGNFDNEEGRLALGLLAAAAPRPVRQSFGGGLLEAMNGVDAWRNQKEDRAAQKQMREMQLAQHAFAMEQARKQAAQAETDRMGMMMAFKPVSGVEANAASGITGPRPEAAAAIGQIPPMDPGSLLQRGMSPQAVQTFMQLTAREQPKLEKLGQGERAGYFKGGKWVDVANNPKEPELPTAVREYEYAKQQGYPGTFQQFQLEQKKAGAQTTSLSVNMDKGFGEVFAKEAAGGLAASRDKAKAAANTLTTLDRASQAVQSGNIITGPGADVRTTLTRIGSVLGVNGKSAEEQLKNTATLLQAQASLAVDGAQALAGQGQITEGERKLVNRMAGGELQEMSAPEISQAIGILRRINAAKIQAHNESLAKVPSQFSQFAPFYKVEMPTAGAPSVMPAPGAPSQSDSSGWSIRPVGGP